MPDKKIEISKAPQPITPLKGSGLIIRAKPGEVLADWNLWKFMPQVEVWEAVALSLDIEPRTLSGLDFRPINGGPFDDCSAEFKRRIKIACAHIDGNLLDCVDWRNVTHHNKVRIAEFAAWALQVFGREKISSKLAAMAQKPSQQTDKPDVPNNTNIDNDKKTWIDNARSIATEFITRHKNINIFPSQSDVCTHVATTMRDKEIYGAHGRPLEVNYIQRNAIQGEWWQKNKP